MKNNSEKALRALEGFFLQAADIGVPCIRRDKGSDLSALAKKRDDPAKDLRTNDTLDGPHSLQDYGWLCLLFSGFYLRQSEFATTLVA